MTMSILGTTSLGVIRRTATRSAMWNVQAFRCASQDVTKVDHHPVDNAEVVSGAPDELLERTVRIFRPAKRATQSGKQDSQCWKIEFDIMEDGNRWENPLMGWASSSDYQQALAVKFTTKESAIDFAEKNGWNYYVQEPQSSKYVKKAYSENYKYSPGKLRMIKTK